MNHLLGTLGFFAHAKERWGRRQERKTSWEQKGQYIIQKKRNLGNHSCQAHDRITQHLCTSMRTRDYRVKLAGFYNPTAAVNSSVRTLVSIRWWLLMLWQNHTLKRAHRHLNFHCFSLTVTDIQHLSLLPAEIFTVRTVSINSIIYYTILKEKYWLRTDALICINISFSWLHLFSFSHPHCPKMVTINSLNPDY